MDKGAQKSSLIFVAGLLCLGVGAVLLVVDIIMIAITPGPEYIADYLRFERTASDTLLSGRWIFTAYVFSGLGVIILLYGIVRRFSKRLK